jgi:hypothetical protein
MVGPRADDAYFDRMIPTREPIETVNPVADIEIVARALAVDGKGLGCDRDIDRAPPNISFGVGMLYDSLVLGRAAGFGSGVGNTAMPWSLRLNGAVIILFFVFDFREGIAFQIVNHRLLRRH